MTVPATTPIRTRREAAELGLKKFWTGRRCQRGHEEMRYTVSGQCLGCIKVTNASYKPNNSPDGVRTLTLKAHHSLFPAILQYVEALELARSLAPSTVGADARERIIATYSGAPPK